MKTIKGDLFGGITAGVVALPLALAFGIQAFGGIDDPSAASIGALAGLVGATMLGFFASLFGGTPSQISGPTGPMTVITAALISGVWASNQSLPAVLIAMSLAGLFCGLFQILFGLIRIGKYVRYIPYPVLSGFMSGIGVIIILQQLYPLVGLKSPVLVVDMVTQLPSRIADGVSLTALLIGLGTIAIIYLFPLITKKVPATLAALVTMTVVSLLIAFPDNLTIGPIPSGLPKPFFAALDISGLDWGQLLTAAVVPGLTLAGLGSIDTLLTSVVADNITKQHHDSNRELVGQGIGNMMAGLFGGIAGAGATMRTVVNVKSGGRGRLSGMVHSLFLLAILLGFHNILLGTFTADPYYMIGKGLLHQLPISGKIQSQILINLFLGSNTALGKISDAIIVITIFNGEFALAFWAVVHLVHQLYPNIHGIIWLIKSIRHCIYKCVIIYAH